ncbi:MAG: ATP-binding protein [Bacteroidales bacterium]
MDSPRGKVWEKLTGKAVDPGNPAAGTFWMVQDINEEKELRELHDRTSTFLKATMDSINDGFLLVDEDMTVHYQNHQFRQLFDMPPEVRDTRDHLVLLEYGARAHRDPREFENLIRGIYQTNTPSDDMLHLKNGKVVHSQSFPLAIEGGNRGRIWWFRDLTRELEKEKALKDQQLKIENIYKAAPVSIGLIVDGKIMEGNDTLFRTMGYTKEEMTGRDAMSTFGTGTEENEGVRGAYARHAHETGIFSDATKWRTRQGTLIDVLVKMVPLDPENPMKAAIFTGLDITDLKRANEKINRLNAELEEKVALRTRQLKAANEDLESFAYSVSHDLRAPLRHVDGFLKLLYQNIGDKNERVDRFYDKTRSATLRMSDMIDDLLSLSRVGRAILHVMPVDLNRLFDSGIATLKDGLPADNGPKWILHDLPVVNGDEGLLQLVAENLLSNAAKYSAREKQPRIEIGPWKENGQTGFYIRDNGVGFDMKYADKLFGVFQRLHSSEEFEGVGIGLANVKQIIQKHDGRIRAESTPGRGATFFVTLPELTLRPDS